MDISCTYPHVVVRCGPGSWPSEHSRVCRRIRLAVAGSFSADYHQGDSSDLYAKKRVRPHAHATIQLTATDRLGIITAANKIKEEVPYCPCRGRGPFCRRHEALSSPATALTIRAPAHSN